MVSSLRLAAPVMMAVTAIMMLCFSVTANSCGLEPSIKGGFSISYPGSIEVAVAVAQARRDGILKDSSLPVSSNALMLDEMLADLRSLQSRLDAVSVDLTENHPVNFDLVLIGPGLWSHYELASDGVSADYHTDGPNNRDAVVVTHHVVLQALLHGELTIEKAAERGLISYRGTDTVTIQKAFNAGLQSHSSVL